MRARALLAALLLLAAGSCSYGPVTARHRFANAMPEPGGHRFAVIVMTTQSRAPEGFLAKFPDGGRARIQAQRMKLWLCDADRGTAAEIATLPRPADVKSGFTAWIVGWDPPDESTGVYVEVGGRRGETSDSGALRWLLRVGVEPVPGRGEAVAFLPNAAVRPPGPGPLPGGRALQLSMGTDSIAVRTDTRPRFEPMFRLDPRTGAIVLLPGAVLPGPPQPEAASRRRGAGESDALSLLRARPKPPSGPHAAPAIWCDSVQLFLRQFAASPMRRGDEPYLDPLAVRSLPACSIELEGSWAGVDPGRTPWGALGKWLLAQGFARDNRYDADGPDGTSALFRRGDRFCAYAASWWPEGPAAGNEGGGPAEEPPTRYRLTVWSSVAR